MSRRWRLALLAVVVLLVHAWISAWFIENRLAWGDRDRPPPRLQALFVRELQPEAPKTPAVAARPVPRRVKPKPVAKPKPAASQPDAPLVAEPPAASEPMPAASVAAASAPEASASETSTAGAEPAASAASQPQAFAWPPSTRLSYQMTGFISGRYGRGPVEGRARVEWIREGEHYQVHLDVSANLFFTREMTSDGELTEQGLVPRRYDEETRVGPLEPRRMTLHFEPEYIVMPDGSTRLRPPGVQDTASQLVQLTWLFTTQPQLLQPGSTIDMPLALPRRLDTWTYQVLQAQTVDTPFGAIETFHVKPRSLAHAKDVLTLETWVAPGLQYLPVRVRISQDEENYLDLVIERKPQQSEK